MVKVKDEGGMMKDECLTTHGEDFTGRTVRLVKEKEIRNFGDAPQVGRDMSRAQRVEA